MHPPARALRFLHPFWALAIVVVLHNAWMLWPYYTGNGGPPWDFLGAYHAVPFYWIEAVRAGASTAWVHVQAMGYPLYLHPQSGFYYPAFWWFALADQTYTFQAAAAMQALHVLLAGLGAGVCARLAGLTWGSALFAAVAYQCFGAFFTNASHPDIVRAHAIVPWLMAPLLARWERSRLFDISAALLPLWVYALWTGGYAGNTVAVGFVAGVLLLVRLVVSRSDQRRAGAWVAVGLAAGMVLAGLMLWPMLADGGQIDRALTWQRLTHEYLRLRDVHALLLRVDDHALFTHDVTMRSLALGAPVVLLLVARPFAGRLHEAAWPALVALLALAMATGLLHRPLAQWLPPLAYSRFPLSDYRGLLGLALVLLAAQAWELAGTPGRRPWQAWAVAAAVGGGLATWGLRLAYGEGWLGRPGSWWLLAALMGGLVVYALALGLGPRLGGERWRPWLLAPLLVLTLLEWHRVHGGSLHWWSPDAAIVVERKFQGFDEARRRLREVLKWPPACRPARQLVPESEMDAMPWRGYYTGEFMSHDYSGPLKFVRNQRVLGHEALGRFGLLPWTMRTLGPDEPTREALLDLPVAPVQCRYYGTREMHYEVDLPRPARVVENEMYWPGWVALLPQGTQAASSTWGFRSWDLPAGRYQLVTVFRPPHRRTALLVFAAGLAVWAAMVLALWKTRRR